jgi:hypothetical protein
MLAPDAASSGIEVMRADYMREPGGAGLGQRASEDMGVGDKAESDAIGARCAVKTIRSIR